MTVKLSCFWNCILHLIFRKLSRCKDRACFVGNGVHVNTVAKLIYNICHHLWVCTETGRAMQKAENGNFDTGGWLGTSARSSTIRFCCSLVMPTAALKISASEPAREQAQLNSDMTSTLAFRGTCTLVWRRKLLLNLLWKHFFPSWMGIIYVLIFLGGIGEWM